MNTILSTQFLTARIGNCQACTELSFEVFSGQSWGILGVNGVGKTTLLLTLAGLHHPVNGAIHYNNVNVDMLNHKQLAQHRGILFQDQTDPFPATVLESVLIGRHPYIKQWQWESRFDTQLARKYLDQVGLAEKENQLISHLSGGERQRVAIATLLTQQAKLLLLDEPTNHLDLNQQIQIMKIFSRLVSESDCATVSIVHDINIAARFCSHILMLFGKGEYLLGESDELLKVDILEDLYGCPITQLNNHQHKLFIPR